MFDKEPGKVQLKFEGFVLDNLKDNSSPPDKSKGIILGSQEFIQKMKNILKNKKKIIEIKKTERFANRPDLSEIFADVSDKEKMNQKIILSNIEYGYTLKEISDYINVHYSSLSKVISKDKKQCDQL